MRHEEGLFVGHDGLELYSQAWLPAGTAKASLVIVHGLGEHSGRFTNLINEVTPHGYSVFALDHRGHGRSPGQRGFVRRFSDFRDDVDSFIQHLNAAKSLNQPLFLFGHSLGGLIVLDAVLNQMSGLSGVVVSAPALDSSAISPIKMAASKVLSRIWPTLSLRTGLDVTGLSRDPEVLEAHQNDALIHGWGTPRLASEASKAMLSCHENVDQLQIPLLMIHGTDDRITSPQCSRGFFDRVTYPEKTYIAYQGGFHESHNDLDHRQVSADVLRWLEAHCLSQDFT